MRLYKVLNKQASSNDDNKPAFDMEDPEVEKAATVLQAGYRGMEARKQVAEMKAEREKRQGKTQMLTFLKHPVLPTVLSFSHTHSTVCVTDLD